MQGPQTQLGSGAGQGSQKASPKHWSLKELNKQREPPKGPLTRHVRVWSLKIHRLTTLIRKLGGTPQETGRTQSSPGSSMYNLDNSCLKATWLPHRVRPSWIAILLTGLSLPTILHLAAGGYEHLHSRPCQLCAWSLIILKTIL